ncbi:sphingosine kinase 1-like [Watersipora subatra]|uniref:sphingosine kinase 1-like n=1 Tax=Watersipora subatra TaxID=2589382 RepID=UPI00355B6E16
MDILSELHKLTFTNLQTKTVCKLQLRDSQLCIIGDDDNEQKAKFVSYEDIVGVKVNKRAEMGDFQYFIDMYAYPSFKTLLSSKFTRKRLHLSLTLNEQDGFTSHQVLLLLREAILGKMSPQCDDMVFRSNKPILVLLNPVAGKGFAKKLFDEKILPMLKEAEMVYQLIVTERNGHGMEIARTIDLTELCGLVIVSGDGLLHEVLQGLMSRPDAEQAIQTPIGILPAGSGNALCCTLNYAAGEPFAYDILVHSTYLLLKRTLKPMDLVLLNTTAGPIYSFLSVTWGLVADIDIESERFRRLGILRFKLEALYRIAKPRSYKGRLSFLPVQPYVTKGRSKTEIVVTAQEPESEVVDTSSRVRSVSMPHSPSKAMSVPEFSHDTTSDKSPINVVPEEIISTHNGSVPSNSPLSSENETLSRSTESHSEKASPILTSSKEMRTPVVDLNMPSLGEPVPGDWVTIDDNFVTVIAAYQTHLGPDQMVTPFASLSDGLIHLLFIRPPVTRMVMLGLLGDFETGAHLRRDVVEYVRVHAFRLEPHASDGNLVVDGEKIKFGAIQGRVLPNRARILTK